MWTLRIAYSLFILAGLAWVLWIGWSYVQLVRRRLFDNRLQVLAALAHIVVVLMLMVFLFGDVVSQFATYSLGDNARHLLGMAALFALLIAPWALIPLAIDSSRHQ